MYNEESVLHIDYCMNLYRLYLQTVMQLYYNIRQYLFLTIILFIMWLTPFVAHYPIIVNQPTPHQNL